MAYIPTKKDLPAIVKLVRPTHWVKNLSLFAALIFSGMLMEHAMFIRVLWAFVYFSFAASAAYVFNDLLDIKADQMHPLKKYRPLASGKVSKQTGLLLAFILTFVSLYGASTLSSLFSVLVGSYILLQIAYSLFLKNLPIIDILIIATGFILRVYAGALIINAHLSVWFLLCVVSVALFLASGKRRAELSALGSDSKSRKSLSKYPTELLNSYVTMFGNAAWMSWALFTFFESPQVSVPVWLFLAELSRATTINKLLMSTVPVAIFGIMRYEKLIFEGRTEAPEKVLLKDIPLVMSVVVWILSVVWILYGGISI